MHLLIYEIEKQPGPSEEQPGRFFFGVGGLPHRDDPLLENAAAKTLSFEDGIENIRSNPVSKPVLLDLLGLSTVGY
jgi:hypothetical protein